MGIEDTDKFVDEIETDTGNYMATVDIKGKKITHLDKLPADNIYESPEHKTVDIVKIQDKKVEFTFSFRISLKTGNKVINIFKNGKFNGTIRENEYLKTNFGPKIDEFFIPTKRNREIPFSEKEKWLINIFDTYQNTDKLVRILFKNNKITIEEFMDKFETGKDKAYKYLRKLEKVGLLKSYKEHGKRYKHKKIYKLGIDKKIIKYIIEKFYSID